MDRKKLAAMLLAGIIASQTLCYNSIFEAAFSAGTSQEIFSDEKQIPAEKSEALIDRLISGGIRSYFP